MLQSLVYQLLQVTNGLLKLVLYDHVAEVDWKRLLDLEVVVDQRLLVRLEIR
jgi:hypothetical protein